MESKVQDRIDSTIKQEQDQYEKDKSNGKESLVQRLSHQE